MIIPFYNISSSLAVLNGGKQCCVVPAKHCLPLFCYIGKFSGQGLPAAVRNDVAEATRRRRRIPLGELFVIEDGDLCSERAGSHYCDNMYHRLRKNSLYVSYFLDVFSHIEIISGQNSCLIAFFFANLSLNSSIPVLILRISTMKNRNIRRPFDKI
ncbi:hypothetical protein DXA13_15925 [Clostridium sp. AM58-1XD]|nr:hypothetical protein DXA13_15925 [Clostridium sp. AM58-1XD]